MIYIPDNRKELVELYRQKVNSENKWRSLYLSEVKINSELLEELIKLKGE